MIHLYDATIYKRASLWLNWRLLLRINHDSGGLANQLSQIKENSSTGSVKRWLAKTGYDGKIIFRSIIAIFKHGEGYRHISESAEGGEDGWRQGGSE